MLESSAVFGIFESRWDAQATGATTAHLNYPDVLRVWTICFCRVSFSFPCVAFGRRPFCQALKELERLPPQQYCTGWVLHQVGRAHFERADYANAKVLFRSVSIFVAHVCTGKTPLKC